MVNIPEARKEITDFRTDLATTEIEYHRARADLANLSRVMMHTTGSDEYQQSLRNIQRAAAEVQRLYMLYQMLKAAQAGAGPIGWISLGIGMVAEAIMLYDSTRGY